MGIDLDALLLAPVMDVFGEGDPTDETSWPLYTPRSAVPPLRLRGAVFDPEYQRVVEMQDGSEQSVSRVSLGVRASLFTAPPQQGDLVFIPSVAATYSVLDPEPDGHGHIKLILGIVG